MNTLTAINSYVNNQTETKRTELLTLHNAIQQALPDGQLWFLDGRNEEGKIVSNPNIGYGHCLMELAGGKTRDFYRIGLSANTSGISVYFMGLKNKRYLQETYGNTIGKASITGYCIKFKSLKDIDLAVLTKAVTEVGHNAML